MERFSLRYCQFNASEATAAVGDDTTGNSSIAVDKIADVGVLDVSAPAYNNTNNTIDSSYTITASNSPTNLDGWTPGSAWASAFSPRLDNPAVPPTAASLVPQTTSQVATGAGNHGIPAPSVLAFPTATIQPVAGLGGTAPALKSVRLPSNVTALSAAGIGGKSSASAEPLSAAASGDPGGPVGAMPAGASPGGFTWNTFTGDTDCGITSLLYISRRRSISPIRARRPSMA